MKIIKDEIFEEALKIFYNIFQKIAKLKLPNMPFKFRKSFYFEVFF